MDRRRAREVAVALLAVVAVALVAVAAVPVFSQDQGAQRPPEMDRAANATADTAGGAPGVPLGTILGGVLAFGLVVVAVQFARDPWSVLQQVLAAVVTVALLLGLVRFLKDLDPPSPERDANIAVRNATSTPAPNGTTGFGSGTSNPLALPVEGLGALAVAAAVVGVVAALAWRSDRVQSALGRVRGTAGDGTDGDLDAVGRVAGDAADRVEDAATATAADNAIYRAWREMVALLDAPDPQSGTPRQFAAAAVEAGMDRDDVAVLTRTFEEVRYGGAALSDERRERAVAALRRIEEAHGERTGDAPAPQSAGVELDFRNGAADSNADPSPEGGG